jgi:hypothetical protein
MVGSPQGGWAPDQCCWLWHDVWESDPLPVDKRQHLGGVVPSDEATNKSHGLDEELSMLVAAKVYTRCSRADTALLAKASVGGE